MSTDRKKSDLEARIAKLEAIEAIRRLKFNYTWFLDKKMWDEYRNIMAEDMTFSGTGHELDKDEFIDVVSNNLAPLVTCHQLHQDFIEITSDSTAKAVWCLRDELYNPAKGAKFKGRAYYKEEYVKLEGEWKISKMVLEYLCSEGSGAVSGDDAKLLRLVM